MQVCVIYCNDTLENIKENQKRKYREDMDLIAKHIISNSKTKKRFIVALATLFFLTDTVFAADPMAKINVAGNTILNIVRTIGYYCCLIGCIIDIIKVLMQGDTKSVAKVMMKYGLAYGALFIFPWIMDLIKSIFS